MAVAACCIHRPNSKKKSSPLQVHHPRPLAREATLLQKAPAMFGGSAEVSQLKDLPHPFNDTGLALKTSRSEVLSYATMVTALLLQDDFEA